MAYPRSMPPRGADIPPSPPAGGIGVGDRNAADGSIPVGVLPLLSWLRQAPFWALSALLHLVLFILLLHLVVRGPDEGDDEPSLPVRISQEWKRPPYDPKRDRTVDEEEVPSRNVPELELPKWERKGEPIEVPDVPVEQLESVTEALADWTPIGVDGPRLPMPFGARVGTSDEDGIGQEAKESAIRAALQWLVRHQSSDGSWKPAGFVERCGRTCRNLDPARHGDGRGFPEHEVGVTGLAILALAGYGHTHIDGTHEHFTEALRRGVDYLLSVQVRSNDPTEDGRFGAAEAEAWIYDHAIATLALAELLVVSRDVLRLRRPAEAAVRLCLRAQNPGAGWRYGVRPGDSDTSVTGWMCLALKTARHAGLSIPREEYDRAFADALRWIDRATAANGRTGYYAPGDEGSRLQKGHPEPYPYSKELSCMTGVGVLCRLLAGESRRSPLVRSGVRILLAHPPLWSDSHASDARGADARGRDARGGDARGRGLSTINLYYWYYGSYALFHYGGAEWSLWNVPMKEALIGAQRRGGDEDGSWDPIGEWGIAGGRVYATAIGAMTLEVYARYERLARK